MHVFTPQIITFQTSSLLHSCRAGESRTRDDVCGRDERLARAQRRERRLLLGERREERATRRHSCRAHEREAQSPRRDVSHLQTQLWRAESIGIT